MITEDDMAKVEPISDKPDMYIIDNENDNVTEQSFSVLQPMTTEPQVISSVQRCQVSEDIQVSGNIAGLPFTPISPSAIFTNPSNQPFTPVSTSSIFTNPSNQLLQGSMFLLETKQFDSTLQTVPPTMFLQEPKVISYEQQQQKLHTSKPK